MFGVKSQILFLQIDGIGVKLLRHDCRCTSPSLQTEADSRHMEQRGTEREAEGGGDGKIKRNRHRENKEMEVEEERGCLIG